MIIPPTVEVDGRTWRLFACSFKSPDGTFSFTFYALSHEHAQLLLQDLKDTAVVDGELMGRSKA